MKRMILGAVLASALFVPTAMTAHQDGHDQDHQTENKKTYYDAAHKDNHEWNADEDTAWGRYREEHHIKQTEFARASKRQQQAYWNWRHEHTDQH